jgi:hypothetical protein
MQEMDTTSVLAKSGEKYLAPSTQLEPERYAFESQIRECYGRCAYSQKTHLKMAERSAAWLRRMKWAQIVLAALTTGGAVSAIFDKSNLVFALATAALSISLLILNTYLKDLNPGEAAEKHREAASHVWNVREAYLSLLTDIRDSSFALSELRKRRDDLQAALYKIYHTAPSFLHRRGARCTTARPAEKNTTYLSTNRSCSCGGFCTKTHFVGFFSARIFQHNDLRSKMWAPIIYQMAAAFGQFDLLVKPTWSLFMHGGSSSSRARIVDRTA